MTEQRLVDSWLESKQESIKPSTYALYKRRCYKLILPIFQKHGIVKGLNVLRTFLVTQYSSKTANDIISMANQILLFAKERHVLKRTYQITSTKKTCEHQKIEILTQREQRLLTRFLVSDMDFSKLGILLSLYTGLRLGEICGLKVGDVDCTEGFLTVKRTIQRISDGVTNPFYHIGPPKTACSERTIPIPNFLIAYLRVLIGNIKNDCYIATGTTNFISPRTYQYRLKSYLRKCDIRDHRFHSLRHTFASRAVELGFDIKSLSEILGHSNVKLTLNLYVHPSMEQKKAEMNLFSTFV